MSWRSGWSSCCRSGPGKRPEARLSDQRRDRALRGADPDGSGGLHLELVGVEVEDARGLGDSQAVVLLHQPGDQCLQLGNPDSQLVVLGGQPRGEAAILLEM